MTLRNTLLLTCCTVFGVVLPFKAFAVCPPNDPTAPVVTVVIGTWTQSAPDQVILDDGNGGPFTYPNGLTIAPLAGGHAVVRVECDTNGDTLTFKNTKITVSTAPTTQVIQYWAKFDTPPRPNGVPASPETGPDVWYKLMGVGTGVIASTNAKAAAGDKIVAKGEIFNPVPGGTWKTIGSVQKTVLSTDPNPIPIFPNTLSWKWSPRPPELRGERHIRGTVTITLKNPADRVELGPDSGIVLINSTSACEDCDLGGGEQPSTWCMTTNSTAHALGCPSCLTEDGMVAENQKLHMFAKSNWDNLSQDIARGQGEHLAALASLMQISRERQNEFFAMTQEHYGSLLLHNRNLSPEAMVAALQERWASQLLVSSID